LRSGQYKFQEIRLEYLIFLVNKCSKHFIKMNISLPADDNGQHSTVLKLIATHSAFVFKGKLEFTALQLIAMNTALVRTFGSHFVAINIAFKANCYGGIHQKVDDKIE